MVNEATRQQILNSLDAAKAKLVIARQEISDARKAGLIAETEAASQKLAALEKTIVQMESVYRVTPPRA